MDEFPNIPFNGYSIRWTQSYPAAAPSVPNQMDVILAIDRLVLAGVTHPAASSLLEQLTGDK
jgi:hypothetical protein